MGGVVGDARKRRWAGEAFWMVKGPTFQGVMRELLAARTAQPEGVEWKPASGTVEDDLRSRIACILEATYWDRGYDDRIAAIRGMCDLATDGMTPVEEGDRG